MRELTGKQSTGACESRVLFSIIFLSTLLVFVAVPLTRLSAQDTISVAGTWGFRLDPKDTGRSARWYDSVLRASIRLPGSLQEQGYGNEVTQDTRWYSGELGGIWRNSPIYAKFRKPDNVRIFEWLQPLKHYIGAAWYQRKITVPRNWAGKRVMLSLERVHWASDLWIDGRYVGSRRSLATSQEYDVTDYIRSGSVHTMTIRVDNSQQVDIGPNPHSISDQTQSDWNGIAGSMLLYAIPPIHMDDIQIYPDIVGKKADVVISIGNADKINGDAVIRLDVRTPNGSTPNILGKLTRRVLLHGKDTILHISYPMGGRVQYWTAFTPILYQMDVSLAVENGENNSEQHAEVSFGMREVGTRGTRFTLNGNLIALRGNVDCAIFPLHGYPQTDERWWIDLWKLYKRWGLNAVRFHSWCPPEAAFRAADEMGIYMEVEVDEWSRFTTAAQDSFFREESTRMLKCYGNHPSFLFMALGNELSADSALLFDLVSYWQRLDPRHLYTGKISGSPLLENFSFYNSGSFGGSGLRYHSGPAASWPPTPMSTAFNAYKPSTTRDYREAVKKYDKPLVAHEIGQRCSYPDVVREPASYTGAFRPAYMDIAREQLKAHGLYARVKDFVRASGAWQVALYKEEIEANLRTKGIGGFNLLDLQDFPGQTTAPVGLLDAFYHNKGAITPSKFREFCAPTVLLARMDKRVYLQSDTFAASFELYNFSGGTLGTQGVSCDITDENGQHVFHQKFSPAHYPVGSNIPIGRIHLPLGNLKTPAKYTLQISIPEREIHNSWDFWVFPDHTPAISAGDIRIAHRFDGSVIHALDSGRTVLLLPDTASIRGGLPICFTDFYWTAFDLHGGESSANGLLLDPNNKVFRYFPTEGHTNWQWWDLLTAARPMILDDFDDPAPFPKNYQPLIQMIDSWKVNRKLGVLIAGKVGRGKLVVCSMDLEHQLDLRPAARQFRFSLLKYIESTDFNPTARFTTDMVENLFYHNGDKTIILDPAKAGSRFDGVGAISAGASTRLLVDYPEPERSQILDYLFKPGYGASMQLLKVEIGGDENSTDGAEASHERDSGVINCDRGYEWWLINEAKKRNPNLKLIGLAWGSPGWVKNFWSKANITYILDWLECAREKGIKIDYLGGWNERGWNADWYIALDSALKRRFPDIKIVAADDIHNPWSIASEMVKNPRLKQAVDVVGVHEACGWRTEYEACASTPDARSLDKPLWNSEHSSLAHDVGAAPLARAMNRLYIQAHVTGNLCWSLVSAWYASLPIADTGPLLAEWPWSGYYEVGKSIWVYAHTAQFTSPGWLYNDGASAMLDSKVSYVTLQSPDQHDFTTVIESMDARARQPLSFSVKGFPDKNRVEVWRTNLKSNDSSEYFRRLDDIAIKNGNFKIDIDPGCVYTLSTTTGHGKGGAVPRASISDRMALPFRADFDRYRPGQLAQYFSDVNGAFEVAPARGGRKRMCYRQVVSAQPVSWIDPKMPPVTLVGDPQWWGDYDASVDMLLEDGGYAELLARVIAQRGLRLAGYHLRLSGDGRWRLYSETLSDTGRTLLRGQSQSGIGIWHRIGIHMRGDSLEVWIDRRLMGIVRDSAHLAGQVGLLVSPWNHAEFDNLEVVPSGPVPYFIPSSKIRARATSSFQGLYHGYDYLPANATDDRPETIWHSNWAPRMALPQSLTLDMGKICATQGLIYQTRLDGSTKGNILAYNVYISTDDVHYRKISTGKWSASDGQKMIRWGEVRGRYLRLEATKAEGGMAAAGEIRVIGAGVR